MNSTLTDTASFTLPLCAYPAGAGAIAAAARPASLTLPSTNLVSVAVTGFAKRSQKPNGAGMTRIHFDGWPLGPHKQTSG